MRFLTKLFFVVGIDQLYITWPGIIDPGPGIGISMSWLWCGGFVKVWSFIFTPSDLIRTSQNLHFSGQNVGF